MHFLRFVSYSLGVPLVGLLLGNLAAAAGGENIGVAVYVAVVLLWVSGITLDVGYRRRDVLVLFVPVWWSDPSSTDT